MIGNTARSKPRWMSALVLVAALFALRVVPAEEHVVRGVDNRGSAFMFFEPDFLAIEPGDRVTFVVDSFDHLPQSVYVPPGAEPWQAEHGQSVTVTFRQEGIYLFECDYHAVMGMAGVLLVGEPVNLDEARQAFEAYKRDRFAMHEDRLDRIWDPVDGPLVHAIARRAAASSISR